MTTGSSKTDIPEFMVGTCISMCPNAELRLRQREDLIHPLEMAVGPNGEKLQYSNPRFMVKEFSRSAAGQEIQASNIRPLPVLAKTVKFLLTNSCCRTDVPWALVYQFLSDRLRAVRQDLCVQGLKNLDCIKLHIACIRFHVYAHYRTCEHDLADFDPYLNNKTIMETLTLVLSYYKDLDEENPDLGGPSVEPETEIDGNWPEEEVEEDLDENKITKDAQANEKNVHEDNTEDDVCRRLEEVNLQETTSEVLFDSSKLAQSSSLDMEAELEERRKAIEKYTLRDEVEALYILVNFGTEEALNHTLSLPKQIRDSALVSLALAMNMAWLTHNYHRVLRLASLLPPLFVLALHPHLATVQRQALTILSRSHSCKGQVFNKDELSNTLFFSDQRSMSEACEHYGISVTEAGVGFNKGSFKVDAPVMKSSRTHWIDELLNKVPLTELLLPQEPQEDDSSDKEGELNPGYASAYLEPDTVKDSYDEAELPSQTDLVGIKENELSKPLSVKQENRYKLCVEGEKSVAYSVPNIDDVFQKSSNSGKLEVSSVGFSLDETDKQLQIQEENVDYLEAESFSLQRRYVEDLSPQQLGGETKERETPLLSKSTEISDSKSLPSSSSMVGDDTDLEIGKCSDIQQGTDEEMNHGEEELTLPCTAVKPPHHTDKQRTLEMLPHDSPCSESDSYKGVTGANERDIRRRRKKEAMAQKVSEMVTKHRANERWQEKKRLVCNPYCLCIVLILLIIGGGILWYLHTSE